MSQSNGFLQRSQSWTENTDRDWSFFDIGEREQGSVRDKGEEEDRRSDELVDPQDRYDYE